MRKARKKYTTGQALLRMWGNAFDFNQKGEKIDVPPNAFSLDPERASRLWHQGKAREWSKKFAARLCELRVKLGLTQQMLAVRARLPVPAIVMAEGGGWIPGYDTASRLCWALDVAAGVALEELI